jgi:O-antigen/teichoic acid export membrane protein
MLQSLKKIMSSKFMKRSKVILLGTIIAQVITFGTSFVITTYYTPEDLGLLGTLGALISIIAGTLCFRLEVAVIQADDEDALEVFVKSTILGGIACSLFCVLCLLLPWDFALKIKHFFIPFILWCWAYCFFFNSKQLPFKYNHLEIASLGGIFRSAFTLLFQLIGGILKPDLGTLLAGRVSGDYIGGITHIKKYIPMFRINHIRRNWLIFIKHHSDFIFFMAPHHLCLSLSNNILIFFLERSHGLVMVGFYALAQRLIMAPIEIIGSTIANVTMQRFGELKENLKELRFFYMKVIFFCLVISSISGAVIWFTSDYFIPFLGPKWIDATYMVKSLVPFFISYLFSMPTTYFLRFINKARLQLGLELAELVIKVSLLSLISWESSDTMVLAYGTTSCLFSFIKTAIVYFLITKKS